MKIFIICLLFMLSACGTTRTSTPRASAPSTSTPRASIPTPSTRATSQAATAQLEEAISDVDGIRSILLVSILGDVVTIQACVEPGALTEATATALLQRSAEVLETASLEFSTILDDGSSASDYIWSNQSDTWRVTPLSATSDACA